MPVLRTRISLGLLLCAALPACVKPDLRITEATARATGPDSARWDCTIENRDYSGNLFTRPGTVVGPLEIHAWSSRDGATPFRPVSVYFSVLGAGSSLPRGQTLHCGGRTTVEGGIDPAVERYLVVTVDPQQKHDEYNESNNSITVEIAKP
jgi:hypothetical protein